MQRNIALNSQIGVMCVLLVWYQMPPATANTMVPALHTLTTALHSLQQVSAFYSLGSLYNNSACLSVRPSSSPLDAGFLPCPLTCTSQYPSSVTFLQANYLACIFYLQ